MATKTADETETVATGEVIPPTSGAHPDYIPGEGVDKIAPANMFGKYGEENPYDHLAEDYDDYPTEDEGNATYANIKAAEESMAAAEDVIGPFTGTTTKKTNDDDPHEKPARAQAGAKTKAAAKK